MFTRSKKIGDLKKTHPCKIEYQVIQVMTF